ncbi:hypothetical protein QTI51_21170 [Variovorax sp. J22G73]|uniref:hypothetical protein n=1 Tax=unclassified Variovorax TaxID=663243 RepID=UPI0025791178|nr:MULTISPECIES: hypothetical protein [unclassified Variovorax]MDM0005783.1 hypothetical protein [Variovorax sp. J22R203]MDM0099810.1 hypothetical protein [Variovorax sp. J22G73]
MAYTLTQARVLLTAAELAVFDQSRAGPVKELTAARLRGKVTRARALRDKYRDLYRRQSVATRKAAAGKRAAAGGDNERTSKKATVFEEVLERFEARLAQLDAKEAKESGVAPKARTVKAAPAKTKNTTKVTKPAARKTAAKAEPAPAAATKKAPTRKSRKPAAKPMSLKTAVKHALELKHAALAAVPVQEHSSKAPATLSPLGAAAAGAPLVTAPLDINPRAARLNPLKERAENIALHAHAGSQNRYAQGKRDSR